MLIAARLPGRNENGPKHDRCLKFIRRSIPEFVRAWGCPLKVIYRLNSLAVNPASDLRWGSTSSPWSFSLARGEESVNRSRFGGDVCEIHFLRRLAGKFPGRVLRNNGGQAPGRRACCFLAAAIRRSGEDDPLWTFPRSGFIRSPLF
jgi:hypothetical protein